MKVEGFLTKMKTTTPSEGGLVEYTLRLNNEEKVPLNQFLGQTIALNYLGEIRCIHCQAKTKKTFGEGSCWNCFQKLAINDMCIMKPETCHYDQGTCRQPEWAEGRCLKPHSLYLSRSSGIKIGITRGGNHLIRWADQGAIEAMIIGTFDNRLQVGLAEKKISSGGIGDRTSWQKMLKNDVTDKSFDEVLEQARELLSPEQRVHLLDSPQAIQLQFPHLEWPLKVKSTKFDKVPEFSGTLTAIKGQYLIFGEQVINLRSQSGYVVAFEFPDL